MALLLAYFYLFCTGKFTSKRKQAPLAAGMNENDIGAFAKSALGYAAKQPQ